MLEIKTVYFTEDGKWFETREEAQEYEDAKEFETLMVNKFDDRDANWVDVYKELLKVYTIYPKHL